LAQILHYLVDSKIFVIRKKHVKGIKLLAAALLVISPFAAQADLITQIIDFTDLSNGSSEVGAFTYAGLGTDNSSQCPDNETPLVERPCARLNQNDALIFSLTAGGLTSGVFDLVDFWWRSTGEQGNSDLRVELLECGGEFCGSSFGYNTVGDNDTVHQEFDVPPSPDAWSSTAIRFSNSGTSVVRIDNITFQYDDGLCSDCVSVPEPGTLALLGMGLLGMGLSRRRKKAL
jgi:hypothetical protein